MLRKIILSSVATLFLFCFPLVGQSKAPEFDHIAVYVRDLQKSADFYQKVIGLQQMAEPFHDGRHVWFHVGGGAQLHVIGGAKEQASQSIDVHFSLRVASLKDFMARLDEMHVAYRSFKGDAKVTDRPDGVRQVYLQDPDGYWIEVNDAKPE